MQLSLNLLARTIIIVLAASQLQNNNLGFVIVYVFKEKKTVTPSNTESGLNNILIQHALIIYEWFQRCMWKSDNNLITKKFFPDRREALITCYIAIPILKYHYWPTTLMPNRMLPWQQSGQKSFNVMFHKKTKHFWRNNNLTHNPQILKILKNNPQI